jgi:leader peptidase (prepilin peptidase)/N-methyltransferase
VPSGWELAPLAWLALIAVPLAFIDVAVQRLPDLLTISAFAGTLALLGTAEGAAHQPWLLVRAVIGAAALAGFYLALWLVFPDQLGLGDVKLAASIGLVLGWTSLQSLLTGTLAGFTLAAIYGGVRLVLYRGTRASQIPLGPFILVGALAAIALLGETQNEGDSTVVPEHEVTPVIGIDYATLGVPTAYQVVEGFAMVRDYQPLVGVSWDDARECVEAEARWLVRAAKALTVGEFDQILSSAAAEEQPEDFDWLFRGLDVGVAGLTLVLSAARYATCYSCRTHPGHGAGIPQVMMAADPQRGRVLAEYAVRAGCGVESAEGLISVYAASVGRLHALAQTMLAARGELEELPQPSWYLRVREYLDCEDPNDFEWAHDEIV